MRWSIALVVGALALGGCAAPRVAPRSSSPTVLRSFGGTLVPGYFVSPAAYEHYVRAQLYTNHGRTLEAVDELRRALAFDGASAYLRTRLGEELLALGRLDEAREELVAALHLDPRLAEAHVDLGRVSMRLGERGKAESSLRYAIEIDPRCEEAYLTLAALYRDQRRPDRELETWRALARRVPSSAQAHEALGRDAAARGDVVSAQAELRRAVALDGSRQEARLQLALALQAEGQLEEAATQLAQAYQRSDDPKLLERMVRLLVAADRLEAARARVDRAEDEASGVTRRMGVGWLRLVTRQPERALALAEQALRGGGAPGALVLAATALEALGRTEEAVQRLERVPPDAAEFSAAQARIGRLLAQRGRWREAAEGIERALARLGSAGPEDAAAALLGALAGVHEQAGQPAAGIEALQAALLRQPRSRELGFALAGAHQRSGNWKQALDVIERTVLAQRPDDARALNFVGYTLTEGGLRLPEARRLLERAISREPYSGEIADSLGWLNVKLGRLEDAERLLLRADRLAPEEPEILGHLGELYLRKQDRVKALESFRRALAHHPEERLRLAFEEKILLLETGRVGSR